MKQLQLNHVALHVADVPTSEKFYREVLQLESIPRPGFTFPGAWFRLGSDQELHLIGDRIQPVHSHNRGNHYALLVDDIDAWERHFQLIGAPSRRQLRPDGAHQVYVTDPDGHVIELCTSPLPPPSSPS
jgi:catechol 2,3-dioxygenase-like lactoylglutathione lyase family enzyme